MRTATFEIGRPAPAKPKPVLRIRYYVLRSPWALADHPEKPRMTAQGVERYRAACAEAYGLHTESAAG